MALTVKSKDGNKKVPSWMKTGKNAQEAVKKEDAIQEQRAAESNKLMRFWLSPGEDASVTFVDGELDEDGVLDAPAVYEHNLNLNGKWGNLFVCTQDEEPCPICEGGDNPMLLSFLTIIDHREYVGKKATYVDTKKVMAVTRATLKLLQKKAAKLGGLAGCTFDISRTAKDEPRVGNVFDYTEKRTIAELQKAYPKADWTPADYPAELNYVEADKLREMGFGSSKPIGKEKSVADHSNEL